MSKVTMNVELEPFRVPNYVIVKQQPTSRGDGLKDAPKYHLSELDTETLTSLVERFRADVFAKANKKPVKEG